MENTLLNKSNSGYGKRLAVLLTVVASFALSTTAWARDDFNDWKFDTDKGWTPETQDFITMGGTANYGLTKTFTLWHIRATASWEEYWVDGVNFVYYLNGKDQDHYVGAHWVGSSCLSDCKGMDVTTGNLGTNLVNDSRIHNPGQNTLHLKFEAKRNDDVVKDNWGYVNFTLPGWKINYPSNGVIDAGTKQIGDDRYEYTAKFNSYGWQYATLTIEGDGFTFINPTTKADLGKKISNFEIKDNYGEATVCFDPKKEKVGTYQTTLKFHGEFGGSSYETTVTLKAKLEPQAPTTVTIGEPAVVGVGPSAVLSGYLKKAGCDRSLTEYGFYVYNGGSCASRLSKITAKGTALAIGDTWKNTVSAGLQPNTNYSYKPYVKSDNANKETKSSACYTFTTGSDVCKFAPADTIYYTIDSSIEHDDPCALVFQSIENALVNLKSHSTNGADDYWWDSNSSMLRNNIVFQIVPNKAGYGVSGGRVSLTNINKYDDKATTPAYELVLRSSDDSKKPRIFGLDLGYSRKVTLKDLHIVRDAPSTTDGKGHACILVGFDSEENGLLVGKMKDAQLRFIGCQIEGDNFCSIHANGIDGLYMEDCNLIAKCSQVSEDTYNWGGSIKFMNCKNVTLLRNNFKGQHSNNIFAQNVQNMLIMNNVFWNDNNLNVTKSGWAASNKLAVIRLINFGANDTGHKIKNVGMYYNTLYLADNGVTTETDKQANFLTLGGVAKGQQTKDKTMYDFSTIDFMYNNCYSYDASLTGKTDDAFCSQTITSSTHITNNNFWDAKAPSTNPSNFAFGNVKYHVNMSREGEIVCWSAPFTPEGLVIKGAGLNEGSKVSSDVSGLGADKITSDRLYQNVRPDGAGWTLGAYQQASAGDPIETIVWEGSENKIWDNRNNWRKLDGSLITCVDVLSTDLKVIIPELDYLQANTRYYPEILPWSETGIDGLPDNERVRAGEGAGSKTTPTMFAKNIDLEYGASIIGIENLYPNESGDKHYESATSHITIDKDEWVLVGSVIAGTESGAYYKNFEPHVYMQQFEEDTEGSVVKWGVPFTQLDEQVGINQSFAIMARNQYGQKEMMSASLYYKVVKNEPDKVNNGTKPETFDLTGPFAYESALPTINLNKGINILNNAYPAVLNKNALTGLSGKTVYVYDYKNSCWSPISTAQEKDKYVKPQSGFIVDATAAGSLNFTHESYDLTKSAKYKNAIENAGLLLYAYNTANGKGSYIGVGTEYSNASKIFNGSVSDNAELYIMGNGENLSTLSMTDASLVVPLGIRNKGAKSMDVKFELTEVDGYDSVILEDRSVNPVARYDLLDGNKPCFLSLPSGDIENRFYLSIGTEEDMPTDNDDVIQDNGSTSIYIYGSHNKVIIGSSDDVVLQKAQITDMAGRTTEVILRDAHYNVIELDGTQGVYNVNVMGDVKSESAKIIVE